MGRLNDKEQIIQDLKDKPPPKKGINRRGIFNKHKLINSADSKSTVARKLKEEHFIQNVRFVELYYYL
jgi:hypothetical protein